VAAGVFLAVTVGVSLWFWSQRLEEDHNFSSQPVQIVFALPEHPPAAAVFVASAKGFFEKRGVRPIFKRFPSGARGFPAMLQGEADMASAADVPIAAAGLRRSDFRVLAAMARIDNEDRIVARRDRGIAAPADLAGKRIGTQKLSAVHFFLDMFLAKHRVKEVQLQFLKAEELVAALGKGDIDAFSMREPYVGQALGVLGDNAVVFEGSNLYVRTEYLLVRSDFLARNRDGAERFLRALIDAEGYIRREPAESRQIVARELKAELSGIEAIWPEMAVEIELGQSALRQLEGEGEWAMRHIEGEKPSGLPNYLSLMDAAPLASVDRRRVTLIN
jgi:ABC-type nitrate/sulfonate/bicarbonate transport system substrate-binding protein